MNDYRVTLSKRFVHLRPYSPPNMLPFFLGQKHRTCVTTCDFQQGLTAELLDLIYTQADGPLWSPTATVSFSASEV